MIRNLGKLWAFIRRDFLDTARDDVPSMLRLDDRQHDDADQTKNGSQFPSKLLVFHRRSKRHLPDLALQRS